MVVNPVVACTHRKSQWWNTWERIQQIHKKMGALYLLRCSINDNFASIEKFGKTYSSG